MKVQIMGKDYLVEQAKLLALNKNNTLGNFEELISCLKSFNDFSFQQKESEIKYLYQSVQKERPKTLCEIGSYKGGSLFFLCQAASEDARIISIDINYSSERIRAHKKFAKGKQKVICIKGNSRRPIMYRMIQLALRGKPLDYLFIDGDHSLFGVMNDYIRYSPLVRKGGIIVFHDINPISSFTSVAGTSTYVGGVPIFWNALRESGVEVNEFIEDPSQDGYGLGFLHK